MATGNKLRKLFLYQLSAGFIVTFVALNFTLKDISLNELLESFKVVNFYYILPVFAILVINYVFRAYRWQALLESTRKLHVLELFPPMMIGFMANLIPGAPGEILRPYLIAKKNNLTFSITFASIIVERLFDLIILLILTVTVFWAQSDLFPRGLEFSGIPVQSLAIKFGQASFCLTVILLAFIYFLVWQPKKLLRMIQWFTTWFPKKWSQKILVSINELALGCLVVKNKRAMAKVTLFSILVWITGIFCWFPLYIAYDLQNITVVSFLVLNVILTICLAVAPTPAFLGSYNAGVLIALHDIMNEAEVKAVSFGMVSWGLFVMTILIGGLYFAISEHLSFKSLAQVKEEGKAALEKFKQQKI